MPVTPSIMHKTYVVNDYSHVVDQKAQLVEGGRFKPILRSTICHDRLSIREQQPKGLFSLKRLRRSIDAVESD